MNCKFKKIILDQLFFQEGPVGPDMMEAESSAFQTWRLEVGWGMGSFKMGKSRRVLWTWGAPQFKGVQTVG